MCLDDVEFPIHGAVFQHADADDLASRGHGRHRNHADQTGQHHAPETTANRHALLDPPGRTNRRALARARTSTPVSLACWHGSCDAIVTPVHPSLARVTSRLSAKSFAWWLTARHERHGDGVFASPAYVSSSTMLPPASRLARAPGGTTQVASYSSTMQRPGARRHRDRARRRTGVSSQPVSGRNRPGAAAGRPLGPARPTRSGTPGPRAGRGRRPGWSTISTGSSGPARWP